MIREADVDGDGQINYVRFSSSPPHAHSLTLLLQAEFVSVRHSCTSPSPPLTLPRRFADDDEPLVAPLPSPSFRPFYFASLDPLLPTNPASSFFATTATRKGPDEYSHLNQCSLNPFCPQRIVSWCCSRGVRLLVRARSSLLARVGVT